MRTIGPSFPDLAGVAEVGTRDQKIGQISARPGRPDGTFEPAKDVRRDQVASMVFRLLDQLAQQGGSNARDGPEALEVARLPSLTSERPDPP